MCFESATHLQCNENSTCVFDNLDQLSDQWFTNGPVHSFRFDSLRASNIKWICVFSQYQLETNHTFKFCSDKMSSEEEDYMSDAFLTKV